MVLYGAYGELENIPPVLHVRLDELHEEQRLRISNNKLMLCNTLTNLAAIPFSSADILVEIGTFLVGTEHIYDLNTVMLNRSEHRPLLLTLHQKAAVKNIVKEVHNTPEIPELVELLDHLDMIFDRDQDF